LPLKITNPTEQVAVLNKWADSIESQILLANRKLLQARNAVVQTDIGDIESIAINVQTGTTYTVDAADRNTLVSMQNPLGGIITLPGIPAPGILAPPIPAAGFSSNFFVYIENASTGQFVVTSSALIDNRSDDVYLGYNQGLLAIYNGRDWFTLRYTPVNRSIQINGVGVSDDYFVSVNYVNGFPVPVTSVAHFHWHDTIPGLVVNSAFDWEIDI
jgi:hypothetical protein